jgi:hypothetical protein
MDIEEFRAGWDDPSFEKRFSRIADQETPAQLRLRLKVMERRSTRWRQINHLLIKACLAGILVLAFLMTVDVINARESLLQNLAFMGAMVAVGAFYWIEKRREKYAVSRMWLPYREFLADEIARLSANVRLDNWASWMFVSAFCCLALYYLPIHASSRLQALYTSVAVAVVAGGRIWDRYKIRSLQSARAELSRYSQSLIQDTE